MEQEDEDRCINDIVVAISPVSCGGCMVICADLIGTGSEEMNSGNNTGSTEACKTDEMVDLQITKVVDNDSGENCPNETEFTFTITVNNIGDLAANDVVIRDVFPDDEIMVITSASATDGTILEGFGTLDWTIPLIAPAGQATMTISAKVLVPGSYQNCASVASVFPSNDPDANNDMDCVDFTVTGSMLPTIEKAFTPEFVQPNVPFKLQIKIFNNEPNPIALTQDLIDVLPSTPGQMVIADDPGLATNLAGVVADPGATQLVVPSGTVLQAGLNTIAVEVQVPTVGDYTNIIPAGDLQTTACGNPVQALAEVNSSLDNVIAPLVTKAFDADVINTGQNVGLTITVENRNGLDFTLTEDFVDEMPPDLMVVGDSNEYLWWRNKLRKY